MSGGSYNYICYDWKFFDRVEIPWSDTEEMAARLEELGYADDAAAATRDIIKQFNDARDKLFEEHAKLSGVWKAVEWYDSGDGREDSIKAELAEYRREAHGVSG